nr:MAG TPA: hypothetical protein [Caudoviricetes sp.]
MLYIYNYQYVINYYHFCMLNYGNGKRSVPLQRHRISERQTRLLGGFIQSL